MQLSSDEDLVTRLRHDQNQDPTSLASSTSPLDQKELETQIKSIVNTLKTQVKIRPLHLKYPTGYQNYVSSA